MEFIKVLVNLFNVIFFFVIEKCVYNNIIFSKIFNKFLIINMLLLVGVKFSV